MSEGNAGGGALSDYIADEVLLGFPFTYPPEYVGAIEWGDRDIDAGGDGHALGFLTKPRIAKDLEFFPGRLLRARLFRSREVRTGMRSIASMAKAPAKFS